MTQIALNLPSEVLKPSREVMQSEAVTLTREARAGIGERPVCLGADELSIRVAKRPAQVTCLACDGIFVAAGPTGYRDDQAVCDACLLTLDAQLGMVLALVSVTRSYGDLDLEETCEAARRELMAFARIYHRYASKFAPRRDIARDLLPERAC